MTAAVTVKRYQNDDKSLWNKFVQEAKNSTFLFDRDFMDYHGKRISDHSLLVFVDDNLRSVLPANEKGDLLISHGGLSYGGLVLENRVHLDEALSYFYYLLRYLEQNGFTEVVYKCMPSYLARLPSFEEQYAMFLLNARLTSRTVSGACSGRLHVSMRQTRRNIVKRAMNSGLRVTRANSPKKFWEILETNLRERHGVEPVHSLDELELLMTRFPDNILCYEVLGEQLLGGTIIFVSHTTAHAQYISANQEGKKSGALDFLFHQLITETFSHKDFFSFGISIGHDGKELNRGLNSWKEGFGAMPFTVDTYALNVRDYSLLNSYA
jgi:hypothetical protein